MVKKIGIAVCFLLFFIFFSPNLSYAQYRSLKKKINRILNDENLKDAFVGVEIFDVNKKRRVYSYNSEKLFTPASNLKIVTTAAALYFLPKNYKFSTYLRITGPVVDSTLFGDLVIKCAGDPIFTNADLDSLVSEVNKYGIKIIRGKLIGDISWSDSLSFGAGWMWDDAQYGFMPFLSPFILNKSRLSIVVAPTVANSLAKVSFVDSSINFPLSNFLLTVKGDSSNFEISRDFVHHKNYFSVNGFISENAQPDTTSLNISEPANFFLNRFRRMCKNQNIEIKGRTVLKRRVPYVAEITAISHSLDSVVTETNKESENIDAEMLLRALSVEYFGEPGSAKNGIKMLDSLIKLSGNNPDDFVIADGCGLSRYNMISPKLIVDIFRFLMNSSTENYRLLINGFPIAGVDGTLKTRMNKGRTYNNVKAKTGTMSAVSSLSGLVRNRRGKNFLFSIMMQNYSAKTKVIRDIQDQICRVLANSR